MLLLPGCRDASAPTEPGPGPALAITSNPALSFRQVSAGTFNTCGVTDDDLAYCWGMNGLGQLGDGTTDNRSTPVPVSGARHFRQVSSGGDHACGVTADDQAYCWGRNDHGQLGNGKRLNRSA